MYLFDNPVLQRELVSNLRLPRSFALLAFYVGALGLLVYAAWPGDQKVDMSSSVEGRALVNLFFFGQYVLVSLMAPSFASGAITGEKERKSFEMLMASPVKPGAIVFGKFATALSQLAVLMIASLPIVMLCLPLGGVQFYEVLAAYFAMISSVALFGMISLWCSSYFVRTSASLVVSYLMILPLALAGALAWNALEGRGSLRVIIVSTIAPLGAMLIGAVLWRDTTKRLMKASEVGSEGKQIIDLETEAEQAVGLYIKRDEFPDRLFAPPKRTTFLPEDANPIYDKEIRSEIFSQGTLMLRLVIQISMVVALPVMGVCLYINTQLAPWYISYVLLFNVLVGPVFSAGSVTSERERETLDLLLTTLITPWQMLWGKLISGLRVATVLTSFLMWPVVLACIMPLDYWNNLPTMAGYFVVVALACLTTSTTALCCSTLFGRTSSSLMASYLVIATLFVAPVAAQLFVRFFLPESSAAAAVQVAEFLSPFSAVFNLPLDVEKYSNADTAEPFVFFGHVAFTLLYNGLLLLLMIWLFNTRWRVSQ
ncbi:MAG: ABC transporter permease subunit [Planctomycetota bacterium]